MNAYETCIICKESISTEQIINLSNENYVYCSTCMRQHIHCANLGIDVDMSSLDEWLLTAPDDYHSDNVLRFRNPATNLSFSKEDLTTIHQWYNKE